jgi:hypothetical protein
MKKLVVNVFGGPSAGKSLVASELYVALKKKHIETELISEFVKQLILEGNVSGIQNQLYLLGTQLHRQMCAYNHAQVVVTDSPILLCGIYRQEDSRYLKDLSIEQHNKFNNLNILLKRGDGYSHSMNGRIHSLVESVALDRKIQNLLDQFEVPYVVHDNFVTPIDGIIRGIEDTIHERI